MSSSIVNATPSRRVVLKSTLLAAATSVVPGGLFASSNANKKILFFTKSAGFQHSVVTRDSSGPAYAERILIDLGKERGFDVEVTKDGTVFDGDLDLYDGFFFYTTGDLTNLGTDHEPPISKKGKQRLIDAVKAGKGFMGSHCASDTFHTPGEAFENQKELDPYIAMLGGEFIRHGRQQEARMRVVSPDFPGLAKRGDGFRLNEEWYSLKNFAPDMHVILVNETEGMVDNDYKRPPYPATWARLHGKGRVFYTSMGHREDVWSNDIFKDLIHGAITWITGQVDIDVTPNMAKVTPDAMKLPSP